MPRGQRQHGGSQAENQAVPSANAGVKPSTGQLMPV